MISNRTAFSGGAIKTDPRYQLSLHVVCLSLRVNRLASSSDEICARAALGEVLMPA